MVRWGKRGAGVLGCESNRIEPNRSRRLDGIHGELDLMELLTFGRMLPLGAALPQMTVLKYGG